MTKLEQYLKEVIAEGHPMDQLRNFLSAGYEPQKKQRAFHKLCRAADLDTGPVEIAFGGARGPGKSHSMFAQMALDDCQRVPGLKALMLRKILKAGRESFDDLRRKILRETPHKYSRVSGQIEFNNGSRMLLGHFKDDRSFEALIGLQYDLIGIEEATTLKGEKYSLIRTCLRSDPRLGWRPRVYSNANPGGVGHAWYKRRFIDGHPGTAFIPATYKDNVFLDAGYEDILASLTGWRRRAWMEGDWDIAAGQYFSTWRPEIHIVKPFKWQSGAMTFYLAMDWGWKHPTVAVLLAVSGEGKVYVVGEYGASKRMPARHSPGLDAMLARVGVLRGDLSAQVIGGDAFKETSDRASFAELFNDLGWRFEAANMTRASGAATVLQYLGEPPEVPAELFVFNTCHNVIRQLPEMQHNPKKLEDVLKVDADDEGYGGDDYYDSLRYGLMEIAEGYGAVVIAPLPGFH